MPTNTETRFVSRVDGPTRFTIQYRRGDESFRLLGVIEPEDDERRERAIVFLKEWLLKGSEHGPYGGVLWFGNFSNAIQDSDGTWIAWTESLVSDREGIDCLNVDLVRAGLADLDYSQFLRYEFRERLYGRFGSYVKWREQLESANRESRPPH